MSGATSVLSIVATMAALALPTSAAAQSSDEAAVRRVAMQQGDTWNAHDAKAYSALFTEDADVVNVVGWWWKGRAEMERNLTAAFAAAFRESTLTFTDVQVRFLTPDIALAHARWTMTGAHMPPGMPEPREGIQTLTMVRQKGKWLISGFQNTNSIPQREFKRPT